MGGSNLTLAHSNCLICTFYSNRYSSYHHVQQPLHAWNKFLRLAAYISKMSITHILPADIKEWVTNCHGILYSIHWMFLSQCFMSLHRDMKRSHPAYFGIVPRPKTMVIGLRARLVHAGNCTLTSKHGWQCLPMLVAKAHGHYMGKALHSVAFL